MLKRWNVHHGAHDLGLMTAKEIRDALRGGSLDAFDKVSAEGSNIREDLIEVDEIFKEGEVEKSTSSQPASAQIAPTADGDAPKAFSAQIASQHSMQLAIGAPSARMPKPMAEDSDETPRTNPPPNIAAPSWRTADSVAITATKDDKESKSTQKRYYLIDKANVLGPVSALEIQSFFNRGGLNQKVKVQRIGGTKAIPVSQFIASFSEDRIKELTEDGKLNQKASSPSSKVLNELARAANAQKIAKDRKNKTYLVLALAGFLFGAAVLVIFDSSQSSRHSPSEVLDNESKKGRPRLLQKPQEEAQEVVTPRDKTQPPPKVVLKQVPEPSKLTPKRQAPTVRTPLSRPAAPATAVTRKPAAQPKPKPLVLAKPKVTSLAASARKEGPIERALSSGGGVQTVGPLSFSISTLESCASKCTLTLQDSTGASIKAVFFKSAYYDQLKGSGGRVYVSGTVRKDGPTATILIQDVR